MSETPAPHVGARLRDIRRALGMTLRDVQERSDGRFTVGSLGAYERGTRMISAERLVALCAVYDVDPDLLFDDAEVASEVSVIIDLDRVEVSDETDLARLCNSVRRMRRHHDGRYLTLRDSDLERLASLRGVGFETLSWQLRQSGLATDAETTPGA